jgi:NitT/TauT family transport system ATP-binding protein
MGLKSEGLNVTYTSVAGRSVVALDGMDLDIQDGEFVTIIGPSGCGKSTLLHCLGGLLEPTSGRVTVDGLPITKPDPNLAAFVFQDYTLLPWKTVAQNAAIGLRFAGKSKEECRQKAREMLALVGLSDFEASYPRELSGGMQQRVAIARAMAMDPRTMLMDEPFGALDEQTRRHLGLEMSRILHERNATVVMVTHSLDEAILWANRIVVLSARPGRISRQIIVEEPFPRSLDFVTKSDFAKVRAELFNLLEASGSQPPADEDSGADPPAPPLVTMLEG